MALELGVILTPKPMLVSIVAGVVGRVKVAHDGVGAWSGVDEGGG